MQNRLLAAADGGLTRTHRTGYFGFCAFLPKQLFDQPPLLSGQRADRPAQIIIRRMVKPGCLKVVVSFSPESLATRCSAYLHSLR